MELHASGHSNTELLGLLDSVDKSAQASLDDIFLVLERVNAVERRFNVPQTPLYHFTSLTCDTTSSMSGHIGGLQALLEKARHKAWTGDACPGVYKPLTFKQCDNHVCNLVRMCFNRKVVDWCFNGNDFKWLIYNRRFGKPLSLHLQLIRAVTKNC